MNRKFIVYFGISEVMRGDSRATIQFLKDTSKVMSDRDAAISIVEFVGRSGHEYVQRSWNNVTDFILDRSFYKQLE